MPEIRTPEISIIIPIYNRAELFETTIDSLLEQDFKNWEALVVDDGSHPEQLELIKKQVERDSRVSLHFKAGEPKGAPASRNLGFMKARGRYILFLDSDDALHPHCLSERLTKASELSLGENYDFLLFPCKVFWDAPGDSSKYQNCDKEIDDLVRFLIWDSPWQTTSPLWTRQALEKLGGWNEKLPSWQDFDLHCRAILRELRYARAKTGLYYWRADSVQKIGKDSVSVEHLKSHIRLLKSYYKRYGVFSQAGSRRDALIGCMQRLCLVMTDAGKEKLARRYWKSICSQLNLNYWEYMIGYIYLKLGVNSRPGRIYRILLRKFYPEYRIPENSHSIFNTSETEIRTWGEDQDA